MHGFQQTKTNKNSEVQFMTEELLRILMLFALKFHVLSKQISKNLDSTWKSIISLEVLLTQVMTIVVKD